MNPKASFTRKQSTSNFPKNEYFLPPDVHTCLYVSGVRNVRFSDNFFPCKIRFAIRPLALLPTNLVSLRDGLGNTEK